MNCVSKIFQTVAVNRYFFFPIKFQYFRSSLMCMSTHLLLKNWTWCASVGQTGVSTATPLTIITCLISVIEIPKTIGSDLHTTQNVSNVNFYSIGRERQGWTPNWKLIRRPWKVVIFHDDRLTSAKSIQNS